MKNSRDFMTQIYTFSAKYQINTSQSLTRPSLHKRTVGRMTPCELYFVELSGCVIFLLSL